MGAEGAGTGLEKGDDLRVLWERCLFPVPSKHLCGCSGLGLSSSTSVLD